MRKLISKKTVVFLSLILTLALLISPMLFSADAADTPGTVRTQIVNLDTEWKYFDNDADPAEGLDSLTAWTRLDYDDSAWKTGKAPFGTKKGSSATINGHRVATLLNYYKPDSTDSIAAAFFRTSVTIEDPTSYTALEMTIAADDCVAIYINGTLVVDGRKTTPTSNTQYIGTKWRENTVTLTGSSLSCLREGENIISAEIRNESATSSDLLFVISDMTLVFEDPNYVVAENVVLNIGADTTQRNLSWFSGNAAAGEVRLAKASDVTDGIFPEEYTTFAVKSSIASNMPARYAKKATLTGLQPDTEYAYMITVGDVASRIYYFKTDVVGDFDFVYVGDPQISKPSHGDEWQDTLQKIEENFGVDLLISGGDQVGTANSEEFYSYLIKDELAGFTFAPTVGPGHDSSCATFSDHFNLPNLSTKYGVGTTSANYWYVYNGVLFMHLNMEDNDALFNGEHEAFITETMAANPTVNWTVLVAHRAPFSTGLHGDPTYKNYETEIARIRPALSALATRTDVDIVLSAHDHVYVRTYIMENDQLAASTIKDNKVVNPDGVLYLTASSSTGSKFYNQSVENAYFVAAENYEKRKSAIHFEVTETTLTFTAYFLDDMSAFDTFTIEKTEVNFEADGNLVTPYGVIDEEYADKEAYPIAVFDNVGTFLGAYDSMNVVFDIYFRYAYDVVVFLRDDLTTVAPQQNNFAAGSGAKIIDLNGKTVSVDISAFLRAEAKAGDKPFKVVVKNGTVSANGNSVLSIGSRDSGSNKRMKFVFEGVSFTNIGDAPIVTDAAIPAASPVSCEVEFNNCTFENPTSNLFTVGNSEQAKISITVAGGKIVTNANTVEPIVSYGEYEDNASFLISEDADGKCLRIYMPKTSELDEISAFADKLVFVRNDAVSTEDNTVYTISEKTPYGYIDEDHLDMLKYPMVLYLGDTVIYPVTYGNESGDTVVQRYFRENPTKDAVLYCRTDCTLTGTNYWTGNIASNFTVDLGGNRITSSSTLLYMQSRSSGPATIVVKNGTLVSGGSVVVYGTVSADNKHSEITFENVVFDSVKKSLMGTIAFTNKNEEVSKYKMSANIYFNNCTFNITSSLTAPLFAFGADTRGTVNVFVNGGVFNIENSQYAIFTTGENTPRTFTMGEYNGDYPRVFIDSTVDMSAVTEKTADGQILGLYKTEETETKTAFVFVPFEITSLNVSLTNDINLVYRVFLPTGFTAPVATFTVDGSVYTVSDYTVDENGLYCFVLESVGPHRMTDTVTASVKATYKGTEYTVTNSDHSVKSYIDKVRTLYAEDEELLDLIDALLVYGAAAQLYTAHNTDNLVAEIGELSDIPLSIIQKDGIASEDYSIKELSLRLGGTVCFGLYVKAADIEGLTLSATKNGETVNIDFSEDKKVGEYYVVYLDGLLVTELDEVYTFSLTKDGTTVGDITELCANTYLSLLSQLAEGELLTLVKALYAYGLAAESYAA